MQSLSQPSLVNKVALIEAKLGNKEASMNKFPFLISTVLTILSSIVCSQSTRAELGWMMEQSTRQNGSFETYLAASMFKFCNKHKGYSVIATPSGLIYLNDKNRKFFNTTVEGTHLNFLMSLMGGAMNRPRSENPVLIPESKIVAGMHTLSYRTALKSDRRSSESLNFVQSTYMVAKEIWVAPSLRKVIAMSLIIPEEILTHYPLEAQCLRRDGNSTLVLKTMAVHRQQMPQSVFSIPKGYKQAKSEGELFIDDYSEALIKSVMSN